MKKGKEYRHELFRMPLFWVGAGLFVLGIILSPVLKNTLLTLVLMLGGGGLAIGCKYLVLKKLKRKN